MLKSIILLKISKVNCIFHCYGHFQQMLKNYRIYPDLDLDVLLSRQALILDYYTYYLHEHVTKKRY